MKEQKTRKVLDINVEGKHFICIFFENVKVNPYHLYEKWYDNGWHKKQIEAYGNFVSVLDHLRNYATWNEWGYKDF